MIEALIFDLDGTLVQTERLKAISYARAAVELRPEVVNEEDVIRAFKDVVGLSRQEVAQELMQRFELEDTARARMSEFDVNRPWQAYVQIRLCIYDEMLTDPQILQEHACPYNIALLQNAQERGLPTGLATMSYCPQVNRVLRILDLKDAFDFVASRDDVETGKPDPEIYQLVAKQLNIPPERCLVIEDSSSGVKAALAANMHCIVVTTDFTRKAIHATDIIDKRWVVDDPSELLSVAKQLLD